MFEFLRMQYRLGRLNAAGLMRYVSAGWLTEEQRRQIVGLAPASPEQEADDE